MHNKIFCKDGNKINIFLGLFGPVEAERIVE